MQTKNKVKHTRVTIFVNYLVITLFLFYGFFLVFYFIRFKPSLNPGSVSIMFGPVVLDWFIGLITIGSYFLLDSLRIINKKRLLGVENLFFFLLLNSLAVAVASVIYHYLVPSLLFFDSMLFFILPMLLLKNIWFLLQFGTVFLKKSFTYSCSAFLIVLLVLFIMGLVMDNAPNVNRIFQQIFNTIFFLSSIAYFFFSGFLCLHFLKTKRISPGQSQ
jgi:hypothetical protein